MNIDRGLFCLILVELAGFTTFVATSADAGPLAAPIEHVELLPHELELQDSIEAAQSRLRAQVLGVGDANAWREMADFYLSYGRYSAADACYAQASELDAAEREAAGNDAADPRIAYRWAVCLELLGRTEESTQAVAPLTSSVEGQLLIDVWFLIGRNALREERVDAAEAAFREIADFPPATYQLAKLFARAGRADDAREFFAKIARSAPNALETHQLARTMSAFGMIGALPPDVDQRVEAAYPGLVHNYAGALVKNIRAQLIAGS